MIQSHPDVDLQGSTQVIHRQAFTVQLLCHISAVQITGENPADHTDKSSYQMVRCPILNIEGR